MHNFVLFERGSAPEAILELLNRSEKRSTSWAICEKNFAPVLKKLRNTPPPRTPEAVMIYSSSGKYVWKLPFSTPGGTFSVAYKTNPGKTPWRYIFNSSLPIREMRNYLRFEKLGLPVAEIIAAGDVRKNFVLRETFIVTGFLENTRDGREFMPGGNHRDEVETRHRFCRMNLELLAKLHHANIFHKAFHPRNLLWRTTPQDMEIFWIDVARCRPVSPRQMPRAIIVDLHTFFRDMRLDRQETLELLQCYAAAAPAQFLPGDAEVILDKLINFRRRLFSRRRYRIFSGD
jgi:tRNA A-37 threonylcarbamoyl transferase component Bud32